MEDVLTAPTGSQGALGDPWPHTLSRREAAIAVYDDVFARFG
jgi:hypothetical protein